MTEEAKAPPVPQTLASRDFKQMIVSKCAAKIQAQYGLTENDYEVIYVERQWRGNKPRGYYLLGGVKPRILFTLLPTEQDFEQFLRNALERVGQVTRLKALVRFEAHTEYHWITELVKEMDKKLLSPDECEVTVTRRVVVKHKVSGLTSMQEAKDTENVTVERLTWLARQELSAVVSVARRLQEELKNEQPAPQAQG